MGGMSQKKPARKLSDVFRDFAEQYRLAGPNARLTLSVFKDDLGRPRGAHIEQSKKDDAEIIIDQI